MPPLKPPQSQGMGNRAGPLSIEQSDQWSRNITSPAVLSFALIAAYFLGLVGFWGAMLLCGLGFVFSNR